MRAAAGRRNAVRLEVALILGLRQGEALGLQWDDVDFDGGTLRVRRALQRAVW
jgi:integrase